MLNIMMRQIFRRTGNYTLFKVFHIEDGRRQFGKVTLGPMKIMEKDVSSAVNFVIEADLESKQHKFSNNWNRQGWNICNCRKRMLKAVPRFHN